MKKNVIISVNTRQTDSNGESDTISLMTEGTYYQKEEKQYISYLESEVTGFDGCRTTLKMETNQLTMVRLGDANTQFIFQPDKRCTGVYNTPYGSFQIHIHTNKLDMDVKDGVGNIKIDYSMEFGESPATHHQFHIKILETK